MIHKPYLARLVVVIAMLLLVIAVAAPRIAAEQSDDAAACDWVVGKPANEYPNPNYATITEAIAALRASNKPYTPLFTICILDGVYNERVQIKDDADVIDELTSLKVIAYPDGDRVRPIIDGTGINLRGLWDSLVTIGVAGVRFEGIEVRNSLARGIAVVAVDSLNRTIRDVRLVDVSVHNNWSDGVIFDGKFENADKKTERRYPKNFAISGSQVYSNAMKSRVMPVIFEGRRSANETHAGAWKFIIEGKLDPWKNPFWQGDFFNYDGDLLLTEPEDQTYFSYEDVDAISIQIGTGANGKDRVFISSPAGAARAIPAKRVSDNKDISFDGADILEFDQNTGKWGLFFNADFMKTATCHQSTGDVPVNSFNLDGFELIKDAANKDQLLVSFEFAGCQYLKLADNSTVIYPGDLLVFSGTLGRETTGTLSYYDGKNYQGRGLTATDNLLDFAIDPKGSLIARLAKTGVRSSDLMEFNKATIQWSRYFDFDLMDSTGNYNFNPMGSRLYAVSIGPDIDGQTRIFISGRCEGTVGLGITATDGTWVQDTEVYHNYGEGLSAFFNAKDVTILRNKVYDNIHTNIYVNDVQTASVDANLVYCTDDRRFWGMGPISSVKYVGYGTANGITNRDEEYKQAGNLAQIQGNETLQSNNLTFSNNIIVGCNRNMEIARQANGPGLRNSAIQGCKIQEPVPMDGLRIIHNTFVESRSEDTVWSIASVGIYDHNVGESQKPCVYVAPYVNSIFANNLVSQRACKGSTAVSDVGKCELANSKQPGGLDMQYNLFQAPIGWTQTGQQTGDPLLVNPVLPTIADEVLPENYQLRTTNSPAYNRGISLIDLPIDLVYDYFFTPRVVGTPDLGAHEIFMEPTCNRQEKDGMTLAFGDVMCGRVSSVNGNWTDTYTFNKQETGYAMAAISLTDFNTEELEVSIKRANGTVMVSDALKIKGEYLLFTGLFGGNYTITVTDKKQVAGSWADYELTLVSPLLISAAAAGLGTGEVADIPFQSGDILAWAPINNIFDWKWWMFFDASDVGVKKNVTNVAAGDPNHPGRILFGLGAMQNFPGIGMTSPNDILVFDPIRYGVDTRGTIGMGLNGSELSVGLVTAGERIDGLDGWVFGYEKDPIKYGCFGFPVSTVGVARVKGWGNLTILQDNEDVFCKVYDEANGGWRPWDWFFDVDGWRDQPSQTVTPGNVPGLAAKNVFALSYDDPDDLMYLTVRGNAEIHGHAVTQKDIFAIKFPSYEWGGIVWSGPDHGWDYLIDAFEWDGQ